MVGEAVKITLVPVVIVLPGLAVIVTEGIDTIFTVIARDDDTDDPHELFAVTLILPLVALAIVFIELVVDVPVQPPGKTHV